MRTSTNAAAVRALLDDVEAKARGQHVLTPGSTLPVMRGVDPSGKFRRLGVVHSYLLVTVSRTCLGSDLNITAWRRIQELLEAAEIPIVWVTSDSASETDNCLRERGLDGLVLGEVPFDVYVGVGLGVVPQSAVIRGSSVLAAWEGAVDTTEVVRAFGIDR